MITFPSWGIRARLLCLVLLFGFIPTAVFMAHMGEEHIREALGQARSDVVQLTLLAAEDQSRILAGAEQILATLAQLPQIRNAPSPECDRLLSDLLRRNRLYLNFGLTDSRGMIIVSALPFHAPVDASDRSWFRRAAATREFAIGEYQIGRITNQPSLNVCHPVIDEQGRIRQYLFAALSLDWLHQFALDSGLPRDGELLVCDRNGTILSHYPDPDRWVGKPAADAPVVRQILAADNHTFRSVGLDGVERLWASTNLARGRDAGGRAAIGLPVGPVLAGAQIEMLRHVGGLTLLCLIAFLVAWIGGNVMIERPVKAMLLTARKLREGDWKARTGVRPGRDELSQLAGALDQMADAVARRQEETRRAYEEAWESMERFRLFMDNTPVVATMKDEDGRLLYINEPFQRVFESDSLKLRGKTDHEWLPPEVAEKTTAHDRAVLEAGQCQEFTETIPTADGKPHRWLVYKFPVRDARNRRFLGCVALDITSRERLEEQLRQAQKMEALGLLAGGVAHDFNNLLTAIMGFGQIMSERLPPEDRGRKNVDEILKAADRAASLTRQLLAFSRNEVVQPRDLDLNAAIADVTKMLRRIIGSDVELRVILGARSAWINADPGHVEQVVMNLAVNARDAMPTGGTLTIETGETEVPRPEAGRIEAGRIEAASQSLPLPPGRYISLAVSDTGIGMSEETRSRIFEPFFTTKERGKGTGLGLSTVYGIVQQSAGAIEVSSELGTGTTFRICFPWVEAPVCVIGKTMPDGRFPHGSETVLVVEDQEIVADAVRAALERCGYTVLEARESARALEICESHAGPIHLLLTDVVLPGLAGPDLARRVVAARPEMRVIYMSGHADVGPDSIDAPGASVSFLRKPFQPESLAARVRDVLDGKPATTA